MGLPYVKAFNNKNVRQMFLTEMIFYTKFYETVPILANLKNSIMQVLHLLAVAKKTLT